MPDPTTPDQRQRQSIRELYGPSYATRYEALWEENDLWKPETEHHVRTIASLLERLDDDVRWLDAGCGTGYFLSRFPEVARAGFDLSPAMLEQARANNPDALFLREQDLCVDVPEWHGAWDLVTCTGQPWSYLATMAELERACDNLAGYTAPDGICMLQPGDLADLNGCRLDYDFSGDPRPPGTTAITGTIWSHWEAEGVHHEHMIWPSLDVWVHWFSKHFRHVEVLHWPHDPPHPILHVPRRVIVATQKRTEGDTERATVAYDPPQIMRNPPHVAVLPDPAPPAEAPPAAPEATPTDPEATPVVEDARGAEPVAAEPVAAEQVAPTGEPAAPTSSPSATDDSVGAPTRLYDQPLSYLVPRLNPLDARFWRRVARRARAARAGRERGPTA